MKKYKAARGATFGNKKAQIYGEALEALERRLGHPPTTEEIVDAAKSKTSSLHDYFQWDVRKAAGHYWLHQARQLVSHIEIFVVVRSKEVPTRAWMNVKRHPEEQTRYVRTEVIAESPYMREQIINYAMREIKDWSTRYRRYREFKVIRQAIKRVGARLGKSSGRAAGQ